MVTVEAAFATLSLGVVVALLMSVFVLLAAQLRVNDAARVAARSAAFGGDDAESLASRAAPGSSIAIDRMAPFWWLRSLRLWRFPFRA